MEKAEIFSFPMVQGSGGCRQSLFNKIFIHAKRLKHGKLGVALAFLPFDVWEATQFSTESHSCRIKLALLIGIVDPYFVPREPKARR
jgi:hypothetical protein